MVDPSRRLFLTGSLTTMATGLAGCTGNYGRSEGTPSDAGRRLIDYLNAEPEAGTFEGRISDKTGFNAGPDERDVVVAVGSSTDGENLSFDPPAMKVTAGTSVSWEWTGEGGFHNVVSTDRSDFDFDSGEPTASGSFERRFDDTGVGLYRCEPHADNGMKGGFVVAK